MMLSPFTIRLIRAYRVAGKSNSEIAHLTATRLRAVQQCTSGRTHRRHHFPTPAQAESFLADWRVLCSDRPFWSVRSEQRPNKASGPNTRASFVDAA